MTREEFDKFHAICREEWLRIAREGGEKKLKRFFCDCPACEIAKRALTGKYVKCKLCPIKHWRAVGKRAAFRCECDSRTAYYRWAHASSITDQAVYARRIANLKWEWMDEYSEIAVKVTDFEAG